jgi:hypothetical protein
MFNYDATANTDDGSCVSFAYGCMDSTMFNYDATANTNDGTCVSFAYGCMDSTMFNYDATVNTNDGSCVAVVYGCMDATASNYDATVNTNDGSCADDVVMGCTASSASNYDPTANTDDGTCIRSSFTSADLHNAYGPYILYSDLTAEHTVVSNACSWGSIQVPTSPYNLHPKSRGYGSLNSNKTICSGLTAKNRDQDKTSGFYILVQDNLDAAGYKIGQNNVELVQYAASMVPGCTNVDAPNYDPLAKVDDGSCQDIIYGCTYRSASNYDATANTDDGSCVDVKSIAIRYMDTYGKVYKGHFIKDTDLTDAHTIVSPQMGNKGSKRSKGVPVYHGHKANGQNRTNKLHYDLGICAWDKWTTQDGHVRYEPYQFGKHQPHDSTCDYCYCGWFFGRVFTRTSALGAPDGNGSEYGGEDGLNSATYGCTGWAPNGFGNNNACDNRNRYGTVNGQTFYVVVEDPLGADEYELLTDWSADAWRIIDYVIPEDHDTELDANQYFDWEEWGHYHPGCSTAQYGCRYGLPFID